MKRGVIFMRARLRCQLISSGFLIVVLLAACGTTSRASLTTDTASNQFTNDAAKVTFLGRYLALPSSVMATEFHIWYQDNSGGRIAGPSDYDIQAVIKVVPQDAAAWTQGRTPITGSTPDLAWAYRLLPDAARWQTHDTPVIYGDETDLLAVFGDDGVLFRRITTAG